MLRKSLLACVVALGCAFSAPAGDPPPVRQFQVLVQEGSGWQLRGTYALHTDARQLAVLLWKDGKRVLIREVVTAPTK